MFQHSAKIVQVDGAVRKHQELRQGQLPFTENPKAGHQSFARVALAHYRRRQGMESRLAVRPEITDARHHQRKQRRQQRLQIIADEKVFLLWLAYDCRRIYGAATMRDRVAVKDRILVLQRIVAVMIAERTFRLSLMRRRVADEGKLGLRHQTMPAGDRVLCHSEFFAAQQGRED